MIDVLVLDEADRMIEDGHFKEMKFILDYIYSKRVEFKKLKLLKQKNTEVDENDPVALENKKFKEHVLDRAKKQNDNLVIKTIEKNKNINVDLSQVVDLYDESQMLEEINANDLIIEELDKDQDEDDDNDQDGKKPKKSKKKRQS